ncbi:MAG TPA: ATP-binding protein [Planctomycetota bacterium]|nr:ATP-binding protein [Planctomycetota bacterium]
MDQSKSPDDALLERLVAEQHDRPLPVVVPREVRLPEVEGKADALIGMRRSGKTYCLLGAIQALLARGVLRSRILYLNLEDDRLGAADLTTLDRALEVFYRRDPKARSEGSWIFLDEVQAVDGWERFARRVLDTEQVRLFVTGSSARQLSTEVATAFRGRSVTVEVLPYGPREAATADGLDWDVKSWPPGAAHRSRLDAFVLDYLQHGGFPAVRSADPYDRVQMLQEYVDLVVLRDVAERHSATNLEALRHLVAALFSANANGFSVSRLHGALSSQGLAVGKATLLAYLAHLVDAYLGFLVPLRTRSARQRAVNARKVYAVDPGLAAAMYGAGATNRGAQLENAVYLELRRRYGRLSESVITWVKTPSGAEVDFAIDDPVRVGAPRLVQVCSTFDAPATRRREVSALSEAMQELGSSSGTIVTLTDEGSLEVDAGTIRIVPAREWFFRSDVWAESEA